MKRLYTILLLLSTPSAAQETATATGAPSAASEVDQYIWLENANDPRALQWTKARSERAETAIAAMPNHAAIEAELKSALASSEEAPEFSFMGARATKFERSSDHPNGVLFVSDRDAAGRPTQWRPILDIDALRKSSGKAYELDLYRSNNRDDCLPPAYTRCIISLSPRGGDEVEIRELDITTGKFVENGFSLPASRTLLTWVDEDHLLIAQSLDGSLTTKSGWAGSVRLWTRGTPISSARTVAAGAATDALMTINGFGQGKDRLAVMTRAIDYSTFQFTLIRPDGSTEIIPLPAKMKMPYPLQGNGRQIFFQLSQATQVGGRLLPIDTLMAYDLRSNAPVDQRLSVVFQPAADEFITSLSAPGRSGFYIVTNKRGVRQISRLSQAPSGWIRTRFPAEAPGISPFVSLSDPNSDDVLIERSGFLVPTTVTLRRGNATTPLFTERPAFDAKGLVAEIRTATSKDGTAIDYYLIRPRKLALDRNLPILMTGYGAWGISISPGYLTSWVGGRSIVPWFNRGGALAIPMIRGGSDRGTAWHTSVKRENRQKSYDDFAAVAQALIDDKLTSRAHLGVFGSSNGGLLAAVMGTQRPDLFGAVVSDVPLTDMLRFDKMGIGGAWVDEFGSPADPAMAEILRSYSPYHNVRRGVAYPPFMITIATSDNRVGPGHARKLAAKLEDVGARVFFLEDQDGGHGVSDPLSRPDLMANRMTFFIGTLM